MPSTVTSATACTRLTLQMAFGGYTVVSDADWPKMYRVRRPDGSLTDMVDLTRARDAARTFAESAVRTIKAAGRAPRAAE